MYMNDLNLRWQKTGMNEEESKWTTIGTTYWFMQSTHSFAIKVMALLLLLTIIALLFESYIANQSMTS